MGGDALMLNWVRQDKPRMNPWSQGISLARMKQKAATNCWFCGLGSVKMYTLRHRIKSSCYKHAIKSSHYNKKAADWVIEL